MRNHVHEIKQEVSKTAEVLGTKIDDNTAVSVQAFAEANQFNKKLAAIERRFMGERDA